MATSKNTRTYAQKRHLWFTQHPVITHTTNIEHNAAHVIYCSLSVTRPWRIMPKASCIMLCQQFLKM